MSTRTSLLKRFDELIEFGTDLKSDACVMFFVLDKYSFAV